MNEAIKAKRKEALLRQVLMLILRNQKAKDQSQNQERRAKLRILRNPRSKYDLEL